MLFLSAIWSMLIFHETPTLSVIVGLLLFIPGFYMATSTKNYELEPPEPVTDDEPDLQNRWGDTFFEIRNYLTSLGLLLIAMSSLILFLANLNKYFDHKNIIMHHFELEISLCAFLMIIGILLLILHKRNVAGITFMLCGLFASVLAITNDNTYLLITFGVFFILISAIFLLEASKKKYFFSALFLIEGGINLAWVFPFLDWMYVVLEIISICFTLYLGLAASNLLPRLPGSKLLTSDENFNF